MSAPGPIPINFTRTLRNLLDQQLRRAQLRDYSETIKAKGNSGTGTVTFNWEDGNYQTVTLTGNPTFAFSNWPGSGEAGLMTIRAIQDATGTRVPTWPTAMKWINGVAATLSTAATAVDLLSIIVDDGTGTYI